MSALSDNNDLVWAMDEFSRRQLATQFIQYFENKLCIYSSSVQQLYSNYNIYFPEEEGRNMVILPDPYAYHDTFQGVPESAVQSTGITIVPGELVGKKGLHLSIPFRAAGQERRYRVVPLQAGLRAISKQRPEDSPFLPVVQKGDLRELKQKMPCLHLHTIRLDRLDGRSSMERADIRKAISEKLPSL
jgi:hypothetical protein